MANNSSFTPAPGDPSKAPDPRRELKTGFDAWKKAGVDSMIIVPRASTHLEYSDIPYVLPASRYGQDLASVYVQAWLDKYLKHEDQPVLTTTKRSKAHRTRRRAGHKRRRGAAAHAAQAGSRSQL